ncbi:iron complex transport system substrate-binding protein [Chitinophaga costaii]|uniref:Iron complex transport system substrate-binding protein n=1 Tax=Chitinophaga costaii TaxID=1335309 RepID=A0A1C4EEF0_9BACT|nr:ABC transporter substrate-binding protein [Chitinophaga costaii]PUZ23876.1 hemin ABC transporter substrate-binding protein [Chitinophaga costaii]SCC42006.1 iron complex transport system substrate-binding protein [Chitinophaga costaii]
MQYLLTLLLFFVGTVQAQQRIVSLNGSISEVLGALGLESQVVGTDITSNYPAAMVSKPKVGHNRNISPEGVLALHPTLVIGLEKQLDPLLVQQLKNAKANVVALPQALSANGIRQMLQQVAAATGTSAKVPVIQQQFDQQLKALHLAPLHQKVLFIYARGAGTLLAGGAGTPVEQMIVLAGGENAMKDFKEYKPLTAESLVAANPDVLLLFTDGLASIGGAEGLLKVPGVAQTNAGKNKRFITMEGELLTGFTLRLPQALQELHNKIQR